MTDTATIDAYGVVTEPATLTIRRLLPGPIERVWAFLTESDLRRQWLAEGEMAMTVGAPFTLTWRNDELTDPPGARPEGFGAEHSMASRITACEPPRKLAFTWGTEGGGVAFDLVPKGGEVLLTVTHTRLPEQPVRLMVAAGWHGHLDILADRISGRTSAPFWDTWRRLRQEYQGRLPA